MFLTGSRRNERTKCTSRVGPRVPRGSSPLHRACICGLPGDNVPFLRRGDNVLRVDDFLLAKATASDESLDEEAYGADHNRECSADLHGD
jgi:hypothetical protein